MFGSFGAVLSTATSLFDSAKARREQKNAREYNFGMWNEENAYNDPSAQMERLKNAGLNPNLVYGNGATTLAARSTPAQAIGNYGLGSAVEKGIQAMRAYQDIEQTDAQTQNLKAQNSLINAQKDEAQARADIAKHNYDLISGTDYIQGEGFLQRIVRKSVGKNTDIKQDGEGDPKKDVIVYDKNKPAVGRNVKSVPESWFPRFW